MQIVDRGSGFPLVFIPGLQGRWEYMRPAVDALSDVCRVLTFSLCDEPSAAAPFVPAAAMDSFVDQVTAALDARGIARAAICGVSFGGLVALRYAAQNPSRTAALIVVSAPGPGWHLKRRHEVYSRVPWLLGPLFLAETPLRVRRELALAIPDRRQRFRFMVEQLRTLVTAPLSLSRMAVRARLIGSADAAAECAHIATPTLIVHGEPALDHVVEGTAAYASLIHNAKTAVLAHTGHLGSITRPREFAAVTAAFLTSIVHEDRNSAA